MMIVIYTQDKTYIEKSIESAKPVLADVYGTKLGTEAYEMLKGKPNGASYRKNGGPLVKVVDTAEASAIKEKEASIGMI